jgi:hypothetical protein
MLRCPLPLMLRCPLPLMLRWPLSLTESTLCDWSSATATPIQAVKKTAMRSLLPFTVLSIAFSRT